jgi:hypothetical protein
VLHDDGVRSKHIPHWRLLHSIPVSDAPSNFAEKVEAPFVRQVSEITNQVGDRMLARVPQCL